MSRIKPPKSKLESVDDADTIEVKREPSVDATQAEDLNSAHIPAAVKQEDSASATNSPAPNSDQPKLSRSPSISSLSGIKLQPDEKVKAANDNGTNSPVKSETSKPVKMGRAQSSKGPPPRVAPLFDHLPDVTSEATSSFLVITSSTYQNKYLGFTESALECDCSEEWDPVTKRNNACDEHSDCINRATKMECGDDCTCGSRCQNQRFSRQMFANVSVIQTEKKGFGLRANVDLKPHDFIFEYIGEVIAEGAFRRRMVAYDQEGIKHFYFMSLSKGEFIDATKKGNLGRFCNHSCNPNCYVDKWVIGDKLRMGIFAEKHIKAGEELVFNYNVDRYGANPQPCYCGESNCTGFIGGKTQTERGTKLSAATIEALGIDDFDEWDTFVAKKPKKRKTGEDDEDYVDSVQSKVLDPDGCTKVMAALMQCKEKWIAVKLLKRIQETQDELVRHRLVRLHGYRILNSQLGAWKDDENIILQILDIIDKLPRITRNKIVDARLDVTLQGLTDHPDGRVASKATDLVEQVQQLEMAYRIPRKQKDDTSTPTKTEPSAFGRRETGQNRKRSRSRSKSPPRGPSISNAPSGPKSAQPIFRARPPPPPFQRGPAPLPRGWFTAQDKSGRTYFYSSDGQTTWARPSRPVDQPPPPPKQPSEQDVIRSIIDNIVSSKDKDKTAPDTPEPVKKDKKEEKWKSYDEDKRKKLYENTLFPHISHVMNKYKHKIPRDDLKRFAKEIAKKLVSSDFKAERVRDPTKIDEKQQKKVKEYCKQFFDKAAHKHKKHEEDKAKRKAHKGDAPTPQISPEASQDVSPDELKKEEMSDDDEDIKMEEHDLDDKVTPETPSETQASLKRKRIDSSPTVKDEEDPTKSPMKKLVVEAPPPPPPPAPPVETPPALTPQDEMDVDGHEHEHKHEHDLGDTNFKDKSMADVRALAQMEGDDEEMLDEGDGTGFERRNGHMENPMVDGQEQVGGEGGLSAVLTPAPPS